MNIKLFKHNAKLSITKYKGYKYMIGNIIIPSDIASPLGTESLEEISLYSIKQIAQYIKRFYGLKADISAIASIIAKVSLD